MPTFSWPNDRLLLFIAGGDAALLRAKEGAEDELGNAVDLVRRNGISRNDALIAVAASGTTPFTLACLREAKARGALTVGIANNPGNRSSKRPSARSVSRPALSRSPARRG